MFGEKSHAAIVQLHRAPVEPGYSIRPIPRDVVGHLGMAQCQKGVVFRARISGAQCGQSEARDKESEGQPRSKKLSGAHDGACAGQESEAFIVP